MKMKMPYFTTQISDHKITNQFMEERYENGHITSRWEIANTFIQINVESFSVQRWYLDEINTKQKLCNI